MKMWGYVRELEASQESTHFSFSRSLSLSMCVCACVFLLPHGRPGEGNGTPLLYSCLENPMDGGAW